jgi:hypothetical protein
MYERMDVNLFLHHIVVRVLINKYVYLDEI